MKANTNSSVALLALILSFHTFSAYSQAPDFVFEAKTESTYYSPMPTPQPLFSGYSNSHNDTGQVDGELVYNGSVTGGIGTAGVTVGMTARTYGAFTSGWDPQKTVTGSTRVSTLIKGGGTAIVSGTCEGSGAVLTADKSGHANVSCYDMPIVGISGAGAAVGPNGGSDSDGFNATFSYIDHGSCTLTSPRYLSGYPGVPYRAATVGILSVSAQASGVGYDGESDVNGSATVSIMLAPVMTPVADCPGPFVSGTPVPNPDLGAALTFQNNSHDADDVETTPTAGLGMCGVAWKITDPEGIETNSTSPTGFSKTVNKPGKWQFQCTVTDNEGLSNVHAYDIPVGPERGCFLHRTEMQYECPAQGGEDRSGTGVDLFCGNAWAMSEDPTPTRGSPLKNDIRVNTRPFIMANEQWLGNASFTYGIRVVEVAGSGGGGMTVNQRILVDGYGYNYDYGLETGGSHPKTPGVFPDLEITSSGFRLEGAGSPQEIYKAGNFNYDFDNTGRLLTITDPNGNEQNITYDSQSRPILISDASSGKTITLEYPAGTGTKVSKITENGGFAYRELTYDGGNRVTSIITKNASHAVIRSIELSYDAQGRIEEVVKDGWKFSDYR